jgi:hypothetical protein
MPCRRAHVVTVSLVLISCTLAIDAQSRLDKPFSDGVFVQPTGGAEDLRLLGRLAKSAGMPLGFQESTLPLRERPSRPVLPARTVRQALNDWVRLDSRYSWQEMNGVGVIRPRDAWSNKGDQLNRRVENILWPDITLIQALLRIGGMVGEPLGESAQTAGKRFNVRITRGSVVELLNTAATAHGGFAWAITSTDRVSMVRAIVFDGDRGGDGLQTISIGLGPPR